MEPMFSGRSKRQKVMRPVRKCIILPLKNRNLVRGIFEIKNEKIQDKKKGRIQAFYERKMRTSGFDGAYKTASGYRMKTGDNSRILEILAATGLSFLAAGWCFLNGINDSEKGKDCFGLWAS